MALVLARSIVVGGSLWLIAAGAVALASPRTAVAAIATMGSTARIHVVEHLVRGAVGAALIACAPASRFPLGFAVVGWFVLASSALILASPREWHHAYARRAAALLGPCWVRVFAPVSLAAGAAVIWATFAS